MMREEAILFSQGISRTGYSFFFFSFALLFSFLKDILPLLKASVLHLTLFG